MPVLRNYIQNSLAMAMRGEPNFDLLNNNIISLLFYLFSDMDK